MRQVALLATLGIVTTLLFSCTHSGADAAGLTPEEVAEQLLEAGNAGDKERFKSFLTVAARKGIESDGGFQLEKNKLEDITIGKAEISGDTASVPARAKSRGKEQHLAVQMKREDGQWRVWGLELTLGPDAKMTLNFEDMGEMLGGMAKSMAEGLGKSLQSEFKKAFDEAAQGGSKAEIAEKKALFEAIQPLDGAAFRRQWTNAVDFRGKTAGDALRTLAGEIGLTVHFAEHAERFLKEVGVDVTGRSRLEAIDRIAADIGLYPIFPSIQSIPGALDKAMSGALDKMVSGAMGKKGSSERDSRPPANAITFAAAPRERPVVYVGPFVVSIPQIEERAPHATGTIHIHVQTFGVDRGVLTLLDDLGETFQIERVVDAKDRSLRAQENVRYWGGGYTRGDAFESTTQISLKHLLRDVERIASVKGMQRLQLAGSVEEIEFTNLEPGTKKTVGDLTLAVKTGGKSTVFEINGPEAEIKNLRARFWAVDAAGNDLGILYQGVNPWGRSKAQANLQTHVDAARVRIKLIREREVLEFPFEFKNLPLARYAEMPAKLKKLDFKHFPAPVEVGFVTFKDRDTGFPKAMLRVTNRSNKKARRVQTRMLYQDASGKVIKEFPNTLSGTFTSEGWQAVAAETRTEEIETTAFFMPAETHTMRVEVDDVEFMDGTKWEKKK